MTPIHTLTNPQRSHRLGRQGAAGPRAKLAVPVALLLAMFVFSAAYPAPAGTLVSHEAYYRLSLVQLKIPGEAAAVGGDLTIRMEKTCGHWRIIGHFDFSVEFRDASRRMRVELAYGSEEDLDGRTLQFESHTAVNGASVLSIKGTASLPEGGGVGHAILTKPARADIALPAGTFFPMAMTHRTIDALERGVRVNSYFLFGGSNPTGPYRVSDVAGGKPLALGRRPAGATGLLDAPSWRVTSAIFDYQSVDAEPLSTSVFQTHANGVVSRMLLDIGFWLPTVNLWRSHLFRSPVVEVACLSQLDAIIALAKLGGGRYKMACCTAFMPKPRLLEGDRYRVAMLCYEVHEPNYPNYFSHFVQTQGLA